jgi:ATP-dependent Clp endopeptidase proteolytic subunit ClpP
MNTQKRNTNMNKKFEEKDMFDLGGSSSSKTLRDLGIYLFAEEVSKSSMKPIVEWIVEENYAKEKKEFLQLIINSPGGDCSACFMLTDFMDGSNIPIRTSAIGEICSCGFLIFIAGEKGTRTVTTNTSILSHQYSWGRGGKHHELIATRKEEDLTFKRMKDHYEKHITIEKKTKKKEVIDMLLRPSDMWLTPEEAIKYGIADKISKKL